MLALVQSSIPVVLLSAGLVLVWNWFSIAQCYLSTLSIGLVFVCTTCVRRCASLVSVLFGPPSALLGPL